MAEELIGTVTHYFGKAHVAAIMIEQGRLCVGDTIHVAGHTSDFTQQVESMQLENQSVEQAGPGDHIGIKVTEHAREHDRVYRVTSD